jgi:hypothetical protein
VLLPARVGFDGDRDVILSDVKRVTSGQQKGRCDVSPYRLF